MTNDDPSIEELREQTDPGTRAQGAGVRDQNRVEDLVDALLDVDERDNGNMLGVRDAEIAALLDVVAGDPELRDDLVSDLEDRLDQDVDGPAETSDLHRLLLRAGVKSAAPQLYEQLEDAVMERARKSL